MKEKKKSGKCRLLGEHHYLDRFRFCSLRPPVALGKIMVMKTKHLAIFLILCSLPLIFLGCAEKGQVRTIPAGDINIAYKIFGRGEPLVMIMGFSGTMDAWDTRVINQLAEHYQVIVFDNRGMGLTSDSPRQYSIKLFADDTAGLIKALKIKRAHILGWSMGTNIAQEFVLDYPELTDKLILYAADPGGTEALQPTPEILRKLTDTTGTPEERNMRLLLLLFPEKWFQAHPDIRQYFPKVTEVSSPENIARQAQAMTDWTGSYSRLGQIKSPVLIITGTEDILTPPANSPLIAKQIPNSQLVEVPGGGHGLMYQDPDQFSRILLDFLKD